MTDALEAFADNTMRYLREEGRLLAEGIDFPPLQMAASYNLEQVLQQVREMGSKHPSE